MMNPRFTRFFWTDYHGVSFWVNDLGERSVGDPDAPSTVAEFLKKREPKAD